MRITSFWTLGLVFILSGCADSAHHKGNVMSQNLAIGTNSEFSHTVTTSASSDEIWRLWITPETWGGWDSGLMSASMEGPFKKDAEGIIMDCSGRKSTFTVSEYNPQQSYAFITALPLATLTVRRYFEESIQGKTTFTHYVKFNGPLGWFFARQFGPSFRAKLPPTMERLARIAKNRTTSLENTLSPQQWEK